MNNVCCDGCMFWNKLGELTGECRKNPPVLIPQLMSDPLDDLNNLRVAYSMTKFPITDGLLGWCGEFKHKVNEQ